MRVYKDIRPRVFKTRVKYRRHFEKALKLLDEAVREMKRDNDKTFIFIEKLEPLTILLLDKNWYGEIPLTADGLPVKSEKTDKFFKKHLCAKYVLSGFNGRMILERSSL